MRKFFYLTILCVAVSVSACKPRQIDVSAPAILPHTVKEMKTAGFWIGKINEPNRIILDAKGIVSFNLRTEKESKLIDDPLAWSGVIDPEGLKKTLRDNLAYFTQQKMFTADSRIAHETFYAPLRVNMNLEGIDGKTQARFAFLAQYDDQRLLPTQEALTKEPGDLEFDEVQNSSLDLGTPMLVQHESKDGVWIFGLTPTSSGWVKKENVAFCSEHQFKAMAGAANFLVVTSAHADIYLDIGLTKHLGACRMGSKFVLLEASDPDVFEIVVPVRSSAGGLIARTAFMSKESAHAGYLAYTQRNVLIQAFKLLNSPYGWGGVNGAQDCSSYMQAIFSTVGIKLPRNSSAQGETGTPSGSLKFDLKPEEKLQIIAQEAIPGETILQMNGHVGLFLGMHEDNAYMIHDTHGFGQKIPGADITWVVNRVVVSDLSLGEGSKKGSLLSRIVNLRLIK